MHPPYAPSCLKYNSTTRLGPSWLAMSVSLLVTEGHKSQYRCYVVYEEEDRHGIVERLVFLASTHSQVDFYVYEYMRS